MKTRYLIGFFVILMLTGLYFVLQFGLQPRPVQKIRLSEFETPQVAAESLSLRLNEELKQNLIVIMGLDPEVVFERDVIAQAIETSKTQGWGFDSIVVDAPVRNFLNDSQAQSFDFKQEFQRLVSGLQSALQTKKRVLLVVSNVDASQRLPGNFFSELQKQISAPMTSLVFSWFPRARGQEVDIRIPCNTNPNDNQGTAQLGCLILQTSRANYRKKMTPGKWVGILDQIGVSEYIFLLNQEP